MSLKIDKVQLDIIMKADGARSEMRKLDDEAKAITKSMRGLKKDSQEYIDKNKKLGEVKAKWAELNGSIALTNKTMRELQSQSKSLNLQMRNMDPNTAKYKEMQVQLTAVNARMRDLRTGAGSARTGLSGLSDQMTSIPGPMGRAAQGVKGLGTAFKALLLNPVGLVLAAIVGTLMLLVKAFKSTDSGATAFAGIMKGLGNVLNVVLDRTVSFYKAIGSLLTLDFEGLKKNTQDAFGGIAASIRDAALAGYEYEQVMDMIKDREAASLIRSAKLKSDIEELKNASKNALLPIEERIRLNDLAMSKSKELLTMEKGFLKEKTQAEVANLASMIEVQGMTLDQKQKQITEWLKLDDTTVEREIARSARFANFYDKNEEAFQSLQKMKSDEILKDAEFAQQTRRIQSESYTFQKTLETEQAANYKKKIEEEKALRDAVIKDNLERGAAYEAKMHKIYQDQVNSIKKAIEASKKSHLDYLQSDKEEGDVELANQLKALAQRKVNEANLLEDKIELNRYSLDAIFDLEARKRNQQMKAELSLAELTEEQILAIKDKYRQRDLDAEGILLHAKQQKVIEWANEGAAIATEFNNIATALGQRELSEYEKNNKHKEGFDADYAAKKAELQEKEAKRGKTIAVLSAVISTASAIIGAIAPPPIGAGPIAGIPLAIAAGITGAAQIAAILAAPLPSAGSLSASAPGAPLASGARVISAPQAADGRYDVLGAQDGKRYNNIRYAGHASTGMVRTPTLYGEAGNELVIDAPTLNRLNMKAPSFVPWVLANRVNQRADGNYASIENQGRANNIADNSQLIAANTVVMKKNAELLQSLIDNGLEAFIMLDQFEKKVALRDKSLKKVV